MAHIAGTNAELAVEGTRAELEPAGTKDMCLESAGFLVRDKMSDIFSCCSALVRL